MVLKLNKSTFYLLALLITAWLLILIGSIIIFKLIVPIPNLAEGREGILLTAIIKALLSTILVIIWILIFVKLRNLTFSKIKGNYLLR